MSICSLHERKCAHAMSQRDIVSLCQKNEISYEVLVLIRINVYAGLIAAAGPLRPGQSVCETSGASQSRAQGAR